jgi:hypothetical protein
MSLSQLFRLWVLFLLAIILLGGSTLPPGDEIERIRAFTRAIEFDYVGWTIDAMGIKLGQAALGTEQYLEGNEQRELITEYLDLIRRIQEVEGQLNDIYADPNVSDADEASQDLRQELDDLINRRRLIEPLAESVVQKQISSVIIDLNLDYGGQPVPPLEYHTTPPPAALIVSPRDEIRQTANISIEPGLSVDEQEALEENVVNSLDVSALVVGIGGVGVYPTMVMQTTDLNWLSEVVAHEWVHNFLTLRPLGINFMTSPELRTMNETTAAIAGKEIGRAVIERYYPELIPPPPAPEPETVSPQPQPESPPQFDFRAEMRETREVTDQLLAEGQIERAETYMELRRRFLWDHGYHIRKLNQAYFAFHGAYADEPGGAAGEDPVGAAVRSLREQNASLADFLNQISWMWSVEQLNKAVNADGG